MNWHYISQAIPIVGAVICIALVILMKMRTEEITARRALIATIIVSALSIALYWSGYDEAAKPSLIARLGLWGMKIKVAIAGIGLAMLSRVQIHALFPVFYSLLGLAIAVGTMMAVALLE